MKTVDTMMPAHSACQLWKWYCHQITWDGPIYDFLVYAVAAVAAAAGMSQQMRSAHAERGEVAAPFGSFKYNSSNLQICLVVQPCDGHCCAAGAVSCRPLTC